jgi:hypothetical protein
MLQRSIRVLYAELCSAHPKLEAAIYQEPGASHADRDLQALRVLVGRAAALDRRLAQLGDALSTGGIELGFATDPGSILPPPRPAPVAAVPVQDPVLRARAEALLLVMSARGIFPSDADKLRVLSCTEGQLIDRWIVRAAMATSAVDVFRD